MRLTTTHWAALGVFAAILAAIPAYYVFFTGNASPFDERATLAAPQEPSGQLSLRRPEPTSSQLVSLDRIYQESIDEARESLHVLAHPREISDSDLVTNQLLVVRSGISSGVYYYYQSDSGARYRRAIRLFSWGYERVEQHGDEIWLAGGGLASAPARMGCDLDDDGRPDCYHIGVGRFHATTFSWREATITLFDCPHWEAESGGSIKGITDAGGSINLTFNTECRRVAGSGSGAALPGSGSRDVTVVGQFGDAHEIDISEVKRARS